MPFDVVSGVSNSTIDINKNHHLLTTMDPPCCFYNRAQNIDPSMGILQKLGWMVLPMELSTNLSVSVSKWQAFVWFCNRPHLDNVYTTTMLCS